MIEAFVNQWSFSTRRLEVYPHLSFALGQMPKCQLASGHFPDAAAAAAAACVAFGISLFYIGPQMNFSKEALHRSTHAINWLLPFTQTERYSLISTRCSQNLMQPFFVLFISCLFFRCFCKWYFFVSYILWTRWASSRCMFHHRCPHIMSLICLGETPCNDWCRMNY